MFLMEEKILKETETDTERSTIYYLCCLTSIKSLRLNKITLELGPGFS